MTKTAEDLLQQKAELIEFKMYRLLTIERTLKNAEDLQPDKQAELKHEHRIINQEIENYQEHAQETESIDTIIQKVVPQQTVRKYTKLVEEKFELYSHLLFREKETYKRIADIRNNMTPDETRITPSYSDGISGSGGISSPTEQAVMAPYNALHMYQRKLQELQCAILEIENGLDLLTHKQRQIMESLFLNENPNKKIMDVDVMAEFDISRGAFYKMKREATLKLAGAWNLL